MDLIEIRKKYPQYKGRSDQELADALYTKMGYAERGADRTEFDATIGNYGDDDDANRATLRGLPPERRKKALKAWARNKVQKERANMSGIGKTVGNAISSVSRGTPIGSFLDEAEASVSGGLHSITGGTLGEPYDEAKAYRNAMDKAHDTDNPVTSTVGKLAGGLASGAPFFKSGNTMLQTMRNSALYGTGAGALHGAGLGDDTEDRIKQAKQGAIFGAATGGILPPVITGLAKAGATAGNTLAPIAAKMREGPDAAAQTIVGQKLRDAEITPGAVADDLAAGQESARMHSNSVAPLPETIGDTSDAMQRLTGSVYRSGGRGSEIVKDALETRQKGTGAFNEGGQADQSSESFRRALTVQDTHSARRTSEEISDLQRTQANELYDKAISSQQPFSLEPAIRETMGAARMFPKGGKMDRQLVKAIRLFHPKNGKPISELQRFDHAKQELDDMIETTLRSGKKKLGRELVSFKHRLIDAVETGGQNKAYAEARAAFGNSATSREAIDLGRQAMKMDSDISRHTYQSLSKADKKNFRIGLHQGALDANALKKPGDNANLIFRQKRVRELMQDAIPRSGKKTGEFYNRPERFADVLRRQDRMTETRKVALGGSPTARNLNDDIDLGASIMQQATNRWRSSGSLSNLGFEMIAAGANKAFGYRKDVGRSIAKILTEGDPEKQRKLLETIAERAKPGKFHEFVQKLDEITATVAATAARITTEKVQ